MPRIETPPPAISQFFRSGLYYWQLGQAATPPSLTNDRLEVSPFWVWRPASFDRIGVHVVSAMNAGATARLGLYHDDGTGTPGTVRIDAGTVALDSGTGEKLITVDLTLQPGLYWAAFQANGYTSGTIAAVNPNIWYPIHAGGVNFNRGLATLAGQTGAFSDNPAVSFTTNIQTTPRVALRAV